MRPQGKVLRDTKANEGGSFSVKVVIPPKKQGIGDWDYADEGTMRVVTTGLTSEREADTYYRYTPFKDTPVSIVIAKLAVPAGIEPHWSCRPRRTC
jgi:hypothetical protein